MSFFGVQDEQPNSVWEEATTMETLQIQKCMIIMD